MLANSKQALVFLFMHCQRSPPSAFSLYTLMRKAAQTTAVFVMKPKCIKALLMKLFHFFKSLGYIFHIKFSQYLVILLQKPFRWNLKGSFFLAIA